MISNGMSQPRTKKCTRCGMHYNEDDIACPYCVGMTNEEIISQVHIKNATEREKHAKIGKYFVVAAIVIAMLMLVLRWAVAGSI